MGKKAMFGSNFWTQIYQNDSFDHHKAFRHFKLNWNLNLTDNEKGDFLTRGISGIRRSLAKSFG